VTVPHCGTDSISFTFLIFVKTFFSVYNALELEFFGDDVLYKLICHFHTLIDSLNALPDAVVMSVCPEQFTIFS